MAEAAIIKRPKQVYVCGAVSDILREFKEKLERRGVVVIRMDELSSTRPFNPPIGTDAVVIGIDQSGHKHSNNVAEVCKKRSLPYAMGELRKWSLIGPRMLEAGIIDQLTPMNGEQEEDVSTPATELTALQHGQLTTNEEATKREATEAVGFLLDALKGKVRSGIIHINDGHAHAEFEYIARMTLDV